MDTDPLFARVGRDTAPIFPSTDPMPVVTADAPPDPPPSRAPSGAARLALIIGGIVAVLALLSAGLAYALPRVARSTAAPDPLVAARGYCAKLTAQDYAGVYPLFAANLQTLLLNADTYATAAGLLDAQQGKATACQPAKATVSKDGKTADAPVVVTRAQAGEGQIDLILARQGNAWRITQAPDLALLPFVTEMALCQDLTASPVDPAAVFQLFSAKLQQQAASPDAFKQRLDQLEFITGAVKSCAIQGYQFSADAASGVFASSTTFANFANVPTTLNMSADATGAWKIDSFVIQVAGFPLKLPN